MHDQLSYLSNYSTSGIEEMYQEYLKDPQKVDQSWAKFFEGFEFARRTYHESDSSNEIFAKEFRVINMINDYRKRGHLFTKTNPVRKRRTYSPTLDLQNYDLDESDLNTVFKAAKEIGLEPSSLENIIAHLKQTYCQSIGVEYTYIRQMDKFNWLKIKLETGANTPVFSAKQKKNILYQITRAVGFEQFLHKRFQGQKRFSLEGAEALIPALQSVIEKGSELGVDEFIIGMPHRGRLNVLANILNKSYGEIFSEFEGFEYEEGNILGDVKYHLGYSSEILSKDGRVLNITLSPNPSHLEAVNPVVEGIARSKIDNEYDNDDSKVLPILIHGDAALAGQGVVYEVIQMEHLKGFSTGGTIHLVVNNQIGFTTNYLEGRSSTYCTDVAKTTLCPVFHINGDDPEAIVHTIQLAMEYRQEFKSDVFIDILCYRRHGHNETDEPRFTQPVLYKLIALHPDVRNLYSSQLIEEGVISSEDFDEMKRQFEMMLQDELSKAREKKTSNIIPLFRKNWKKIHSAISEDFYVRTDTSVRKEILFKISESINLLPENLKIFDKSRRLLQTRHVLIKEGKNMDWATCEHLAFASLLIEGFPVRFTGQDSGRGTFSQRHAVLTIEDSVEEYTPLNHISEKQSTFMIFNSLLSEYAVLGYEYGYAMVNPNVLTIWEAQFGDFSNGAQIIIDQFISSAEDKWMTMNGLVLLLPHGYEGQGPEHSSARMERFLVLCGNNNMQIVNCSTPANYFHLLRRQVKRNIRKPLIIFTPKSLLRNPACISSLDELSDGTFMEIIDDNTAKPSNVRKVICCTGKIYYDLVSERTIRNLKDIAVIRIEQIYPVPEKDLENIFIKYRHVENWIWVQEEPENMGAWPFIQRKIKEPAFNVVARPESGSPAGGLSINHKKRQLAIINIALS